MITQNYKNRLLLPLILLAILYACISEHDYQTDADKPLEPLTVSGAMDWYNASVGMLEKQKSTADNSDEISYKPFGNLAELFTDELWYAVESPLDLGDRSLMIMTPEVSNYSETHGDDAIKQTMKLVVLRNKETGDTYSFIMAVIPELGYMLRKGDGLNEITYLSRDSDFDGYIFFYTLDGQLINGWLYEEGKVTGGINLSGDEKRTKIGQAMAIEITVCRTYMFEYAGISSNRVDCETYTEVVYAYGGTGYSFSGGGVNTQYPYLGGGSGNNNNNSKLPLEPLPMDEMEEPNDPCQSMASKMKSTDFTKMLSDLKALTGSNYEAGRSYTYDYTGKYIFTSHNGSPGQPEIIYNPRNISKIDGFIHSHYEGLLKTFSPADLVAPYNWFTYKNGINNMNTFSLGLVTSEGTYFLFISDWTKYKAFGQTYGDEMGINMLSNMYKHTYKIDENTSATTSMQNLVSLLNRAGSGLTLMKDIGNNKFSIVTKDSNGNVKLINCN